MDFERDVRRDNEAHQLLLGHTPGPEKQSGESQGRSANPRWCRPYRYGDAADQPPSDDDVGHTLSLLRAAKSGAS